MIRFLRGAALALVAAALVGCQNTAGTYNDVHTGVSGKHSKFYSAHGGLFDNLNAAAMVGTQNGVTKYGVGVRYISTGLVWSFFREAWSFGNKLPYSVVRENVMGCSGGCTMVEEGSIVLTKAQFEAAAKNGFEFKLVGRNRSVVGKLPAAAFAEALAQ